MAIEVIHKGPGYYVLVTDVASTMTHYSGFMRGSLKDARVRAAFQDLIANPELISQIPELAQSEGLREMVAITNIAGSTLTTIGCDWHAFENSDDSSPLRHSVGGYVNYAFRDIERAGDIEEHKELARWILQGIKPLADPLCASYELMVEPLKNFYGHLGKFSLEAKVVGSGETFELAWQSFNEGAKAAAWALSPLNGRNSASRF